MVIVKADKTDLKTILELQYLAYQSEARLLNDYGIPPLKQTYDEIGQEYEKSVFLKAIDENRAIIGSVRAFTENNTVFIGKLIVRPEMQGQGIGTKLLSAIEQECPAARFELFTSNKSVRTIRLYEHLGYVKFKEEKVSDKLTIVYLEKCMAAPV